MVLRRSVVQGLTLLRQPGVDLCCQGVDAPTQVNACTVQGAELPTFRTEAWPGIMCGAGGMHGQELPTECTANAAAVRPAA